MLCTGGLGGMRTVVEGYRSDGLFDRYSVRWVVTNVDESLRERLGVWLGAYWSVCKMLLRGQVSAMHSHMAMRGSFWRKSAFNATARAFGVPVLGHLHGSEFETFYANQPAWRQRFIAREFERCHQVLVLSESWLSFIQSIAPRARVMVLPNYVRMPAGAASVAAEPGQVNMLFLGAVGTRKGIYDLIPALAKATTSAPGLRLRIGGSGEIDKAMTLAKEHKVDGLVEFAGWVSGEQKVQALKQAQIYVLPSHNEGLPMSLLEAMSYGVPVIATRVGGIPELVRDGVDGLLVDAGDVDALAAAMVSLARDPVRRLSMGEAARTRVTHHYSDVAVLPRLYAVYDELLRIGKNGAGEAIRTSG